MPENCKDKINQNSSLEDREKFVKLKYIKKKWTDEDD